MRHDPFTYLFGEIASLGIVVGAVATVLPSIATLLAIAWYFANLWDWIERRRSRSNLPPDAAEEGFQDGPEPEDHAHHNIEEWRL